MRFQDILTKLIADDVVLIAGGAIQIKKKLREIIGGIPVYNFYMDFPEEGNEPIEFTSYHEMEEYSYGSFSNLFKRCICCEEIPEHGYYKNNETNHVFCSYSCLVNWMNNEFGIGHWQVGTGSFKKLQFYVEIDKCIVEDFSSDCNYIEQDGRYFREYDIEYISPYEPPVETIDNGLFEEIEALLDAEIEGLWATAVQMHNKEEKLVENEETQSEG